MNEVAMEEVGGRWAKAVGKGLTEVVEIILRKE
jgi:hypothetical protein